MDVELVERLVVVGVDLTPEARCECTIGIREVVVPLVYGRSARDRLGPRQLREPVDGGLDPPERTRSELCWFWKQRGHDQSPSSGFGVAECTGPFVRASPRPAPLEVRMASTRPLGCSATWSTVRAASSERRRAATNPTRSRARSRRPLHDRRPGRRHRPRGGPSPLRRCPGSARREPGRARRDPRGGGCRGLRMTPRAELVSGPRSPAGSTSLASAFASGPPAPSSASPPRWPGSGARRCGSGRRWLRWAERRRAPEQPKT